MNWINQVGKFLYVGISKLLTTPIIELGGNHLSLGSILFIILLAIAVFILSRAVSQWIKRSLLTRMGFTRGSQEAAATVISYFLMAIGYVIVLQTAGFNLSSLAVLAGVLGIGFGFGLQNLAGNFISGLTLLLERPIKVGDFMQVGQLAGTVEKISIRSTIIRTEDGISVIVPNNHFVENNIINWSYNDSKCRIHIPVGVAYGSDPVLVTEALLSAARSESSVLSSPSPKVWLKSFGDSALNFELLVWINHPELSDPIKSSLNFLIEKELRDRGIEIPFPQREIEIKNLRELSGFLPTGKPVEFTDSATSLSGSSSSDDLDVSKKNTHTWTLQGLLRRITYFDQCSDAEIRGLIENGYRKIFASGDVICQENDPGDSFYIILSGSAEVYSNRVGKYIATLHAGEFFGEISLLTGIPRSATVRALEETILFVVDRNDLQQLLANQKGLAEQIAGKLAERQQVLQELGLQDEQTLKQLGETPLSWIRNRIQTIFGV